LQQVYLLRYDSWDEIAFWPQRFEITGGKPEMTYITGGKDLLTLKTMTILAPFVKKMTEKIPHVPKKGL